MVRKQIYLGPQQEERLKARARELGISEAELICRCIDPAARAPLRRLPDHRFWEDERESIRQRMEREVPQTGRTWKREELYPSEYARHGQLIEEVAYANPFDPAFDLRSLLAAGKFR